MVSATAAEPNLPKCLGDLYSESNRDLTHEELVKQRKKIADELEVTKHEALHLEVATRKQSTRLEWFNHEIGRIAASITYQVLHTNQGKPSSSLIELICSSQHKKVTAASLEWGRRNEDAARSEYRKKTSSRPYRLFVYDGWINRKPKVSLLRSKS